MSGELTLCEAIELDERVAVGSAFRFHGKLGRERVDEWRSSVGLTLPEGLLEFWARYGGGEMFESEEFLSPEGGPAIGSDTASVNAAFGSIGLPAGIFVFEVGRWVSGIRLEDQSIALLDRKTLAPVADFRALVDWYYSIRGNYAEAYGLR